MDEIQPAVLVAAIQPRPVVRDRHAERLAAQFIATDDGKATGIQFDDTARFPGRYVHAIARRVDRQLSARLRKGNAPDDAAAVVGQRAGTQAVEIGGDVQGSAIGRQRSAQRVAFHGDRAGAASPRQIDDGDIFRELVRHPGAVTGWCEDDARGCDADG